MKPIKSYSSYSIIIIDDSSAEFVRMLSISVSEHRVIVFGMAICGDYGLKIFLPDCHFHNVKGQC